MKPLYLQVFYTFKIHSCQAILIILLYVLLNSDPLSVIYYASDSAVLKSYNLYQSFVAEQRCIYYGFGGEFINLLFWNTYSLTKLAGFKFPAGDCRVQRFRGIGGVGFENGRAAGGTECWSLCLAFIQAQSLQHCPFLCQYDPLKMSPTL